MSGFSLALLTAAFESGIDLCNKVNLKKLDPYVVGWGLNMCALPIVFSVLLAEGLPQLGENFLWIFLVTLALDVLSAFLYLSALKESDISLAVPFISFSPLIIACIAPIVLGEFPEWSGLSGALLIVCGAYVLNLDQRKNGLLAPFQALIRLRGPRLMLGVAVIWSITATAHKLGIQNSSTPFWASSLLAGRGVVFLYFSFRYSSNIQKQIQDGWKLLLFASLCFAGGHLCLMKAMELMYVVYVIATKRLSIVISTLMGHLLLGELGLRRRLPGALIMLAGVCLIALSG